MIVSHMKNFKLFKLSLTRETEKSEIKDQQDMIIIRCHDVTDHSHTGPLKIMLSVTQGVT